MAKKKRRGHKPRPKKNKVTESKFRGIKNRDDELTKMSERDGTDIDQIEEEITTRKRGRGDSSKLLRNPDSIREDLKLVEQAVRKGWNVKRKSMLRRRLEEIAEKKTAVVMTKLGPCDLESAADELAIKAAKILVAMDSADVARVSEFTKENKDQQSSSTVNINVNNNQFNLDSRTIELVRIAQNLGAREFLIDGRSIPIAELIGSDSSIPTNSQATKSDL